MNVIKSKIKIMILIVLTEYDGDSLPCRGKGWVFNSTEHLLYFEARELRKGYKERRGEWEKG
jgi:hypothetical protein